jgi:hypothetical protein
VRLLVHAETAAADDGHPDAAEVVAEVRDERLSVRRGGTCARDDDGVLVSSANEPLPRTHSASGTPRPTRPVSRPSGQSQSSGVSSRAMMLSRVNNAKTGLGVKDHVKVYDRDDVTGHVAM